MIPDAVIAQIEYTAQGPEGAAFLILSRRDEHGTLLPSGDEPSVMLTERVKADFEARDGDDFVILAVREPGQTLVMGMQVGTYLELLAVGDEATGHRRAEHDLIALSLTSLREMQATYYLVEGEVGNLPHLFMLACYLIFDEPWEDAQAKVVNAVRQVQARTGESDFPTDPAHYPYLPVSEFRLPAHYRLVQAQSGEWKDDCPCSGCELRRMMLGEMNAQQGEERARQMIAEEQGRLSRDALLLAPGEAFPLPTTRKAASA